MEDSQGGGALRKFGKISTGVLDTNIVFGKEVGEFWDNMADFKRE